MSTFNNSIGTTSPAFAIGGPTGPSVQADPIAAALNALAANGILAPMRIGWAVGPNDAVSLFQLGLILSPTVGPTDPTVALISPV
jgi:hypothetical protein